MFWRLLLAFLFLALFAAALARLAFGELSSILALLAVAAIALLPAWLLARRFVRPLQELAEGANRIAEGEYGHQIHGGNWGESRFLAGTFNQMSQRLEAQFQQLEADRHLLRTILGGMVEGVVAFGSGQRVLFANETAGRMLEFNPQTAMGRPLWEVARQPQLHDLLARAFKGAEAYREEFDWTGPNPRRLAVYVAPLSGDRAGSAVLVLHDLSELRRLERLRQDFVANVSHELKTPLSVIKACIEALLDGAVDDLEARRPFLEQIHEQGERLHALILDLISLARIESGEAQLDLQAIPVDQTVAESLERHRPRAEVKRIDLRADSPADAGAIRVVADDEALGQVLDNLVDNAIKYTQEGGRIGVSWRLHGNQVLFEVQDNGPGIPERDLPRIFERFYRVDKARSRQLGGTGLGLAIVKHLVEGMHGSVKARSQVGRGTTFTISLPQAPETA
jgi:two-component system, OmpR family, phosphate regulon sensor histidine kinase PhoR